MPNDRELAVLFWLGAIGVFMLWRSDTRSALGGVAWALLQPKLAAAFLLLLATVVALCSGGSYIGLWDPDLATDTVSWFFGAGAVLFLRIDQASEPKFFRKAVTQTLALTEFLAFFVNLFVFGLLVELLLQPLVFFLVAMVAVAASKPEYASVRRLMESLLTLVGGIVLVFAAVRIAQTWGEVDLPGVFRALFLPVWLTIGILPLIYVIALLAGYETAFARARFSLNRQSASWRVRLAILVSFHVRLAELKSMESFRLREIAEASSFREARRKIEGSREARRASEAEASAALGRLDTFASASGTDADGRRLDQREFSETKEALQSLASAQMGWYRNRGERYRSDLAEILDSQFEQIGLPEPRGVAITVSADGQAWYASRRTITGWCFATGSAARPPDQWLYDGPEPPAGFPGEAPGWSRFGLEANNW